MKKILISILFGLGTMICAQDFTTLTGDYLGQTPPGDIPEIFAPGIVSTPKHQHSAPAFSTQGKGCYLFFSPKGTTFQLSKESANAASNEYFSIELNFVNSNPNPEISGHDCLAAKTNYYLGNDSAEWYTGISNYKKIYLKEVYKGIDLIYYGNHNKLEYDFIVKPSVDPQQIRLSCNLENKAKNSISLSDNGDLHISTPLGTIIENKPYCYQTINGKKVEIEGSYRILDSESNTYVSGIGSCGKCLVCREYDVIRFSSDNSLY